MKLIGLGLALVVAVVGGFLLATLRRQSPDARIDRSSTSEPADSDARATHRTERRGPGKRQVVGEDSARLAPHVAALGELGEPTDDTPPSDVEPAPPPTEPETLPDGERYAYAQSIFEAEVLDPSWAPESERHFTSVLTTLSEPTVRFNSVKCRTNLCRIELEAGNASAGEKYLRTLVRSANWDGPGMTVRDAPDASGAVRLTVYFAREGTPLPEPAADG